MKRVRRTRRSLRRRLISKRIKIVDKIAPLK
jgi:hypothetical protein